MADPMRKVVKSERYTPKYAKPGAGSVILTLSCGHTVRRKASRKIPQEARCFNCGLERKD